MRVPSEKARARARARERERERKREREKAGKGRNNKKEQMPAAIKTTESIKNFRSFTAEPASRRSMVEYMREKSTTITMR